MTTTLCHWRALSLSLHAAAADRIRNQNFRNHGPARRSPFDAARRELVVAANDEKLVTVVTDEKIGARARIEFVRERFANAQSVDYRHELPDFKGRNFA